MAARPHRHARALHPACGTRADPRTPLRCSARDRRGVRPLQERCLRGRLLGQTTPEMGYAELCKLFELGIRGCDLRSQHAAPTTGCSTPITCCTAAVRASKSAGCSPCSRVKSRYSARAICPPRSRAVSSVQCTRARSTPSATTHSTSTPSA